MPYFNLIFFIFFSSLTPDEEPDGEQGDQTLKNNKNNPFLENAENVSVADSSVQIDDVSKLKTAPNSASFPSRQLVYSPESPSTSSCPPLSPQRPHPAPAKLGFLVSFLVDARGGAMKGNRGSGMRLIIPPGNYFFSVFLAFSTLLELQLNT